MMKKKWLSLLLAGILSCSSLLIAGCKGCNNEDTSGDDGESVKQEATVIKDKFIVQEGISDYYVVIPKDAMDEEAYAALEFNYFMEMATGCTFKTITENQVKSNYKYISIGKTEQFEDNFQGVDLTSLDGTNSAYFISTKGNNIYIASSNSFRGEGCLYGTYDLLHDLIGYTYYHETEIYVEEKSDVNLLSYNNFFVFPTFDIRCVSTAYNYSNETHNTRLRFMNFSRGWEWNDATFGHGAIQAYIDPTHIAPGSGGKTWGELHPDWFMYPDVGDELPNIGNMVENQHCMTAYETGLDEAIANRLIEFISADPEAKYFMFGQEDNHTWCSCARCTKALQDYAGTASGLQVAFMNRVVEKVEAWLDENQPEREIEYVIYAYQPTEEAPVKVVDGETVPYSKQVIPHEKLRIMLCPIGANFAYSFDSPQNTSFMNALMGWSKVAAGKIFIYSYDLNVTHYFVHFNNFGSAASMYKTCKDYGVTFYLAQGISDSNSGCLDEMRSYVESALLWDVSQNYDDLAHDFINHYYKEASDYLWNYYMDIRDRYAYYQAAIAPQSGTVWGDIDSADLYTYEFTESIAAHLDGALDAIAALQESDSARYALLKNRIMKEYLTVIYVRITLYKGYFNDLQIAEMKENWDFYTSYFGITNGGEGAGLPNIFG